jgi:glutamyl/glutaminyl-tRNA synthetase
VALLRYIGRLAPSPTGLLHLGHAATFLAAYERAEAAGGNLVLRIDDLDPQRSKTEFVDAAVEDLRWLGMSWTAEYRQAERLDLYRRAMRRLLDMSFAYPCACSRKELQEATQAPHEDTDDEPVYSGRCRPSQASQRFQLETGTNYRLRVPDGETVTFLDGHCGPQGFIAGQHFGDFLIWRKDGLPSYQLACVVDDADMRITEVVRGRDLLKSTARQILLQRALDLLTPAYFHTDLLRDEHGQRLAKRHDALSLRSLRSAGVTPSEIRARVEGLLHHTG